MRAVTIVVGLPACGHEPAGVSTDAPTQDSVDVDGYTTPDGPRWSKRWGAPAPISELNTAAEDAQGTMTEDLLFICFASNRVAGPGTGDIWCARRSTRFAPFETPVLQATVSSTAIDWMPALSADGAELFFSSDRAGGAGAFDLYRSEWVEAAGAFGPATKVTELNSSAWDTGPALSGDGLTLYFDSGRRAPNAPSTIYVASRTNRTSPFGAPTLVAALDSMKGDGEPGPSSDLAQMVFCSMRPGGGQVAPEIFALWGADRTTSGWSEPYVLDIDQPAGVGGCGPQILSDGSLLFHSGRAGGPSDLYIAPAITTAR